MSTDDRIRAIEAEQERLRELVEDDQDQREAMALLPQRVDDLRAALTDIRSAVGDLRDALTHKAPDGSYVAAPGKFDFKTWLLIVSAVVLPTLAIVVPIVATR